MRPLEGCICVVDVVNENGEDRSTINAKALIKLGAKVMPKLEVEGSNQTTHLVWANSEPKRVRTALAAGIHVVSPQWVSACTTSKSKVCEENYAVAMLMPVIAIPPTGTYGHVVNPFNMPASSPHQAFTTKAAAQLITTDQMPHVPAASMQSIVVDAANRCSDVRHVSSPREELSTLTNTLDNTNTGTNSEVNVHSDSDASGLSFVAQLLQSAEGRKRLRGVEEPDGGAVVSTDIPLPKWKLLLPLPESNHSREQESCTVQAEETELGPGRRRRSERVLDMVPLSQDPNWDPDQMDAYVISPSKLRKDSYSGESKGSRRSAVDAEISEDQYRQALLRDPNFVPYKCPDLPAVHGLADDACETEDSEDQQAPIATHIPGDVGTVADASASELFPLSGQDNLVDRRTVVLLGLPDQLASSGSAGDLVTSVLLKRKRLQELRLRLQARFNLEQYSCSQHSANASPAPSASLVTDKRSPSRTPALSPAAHPVMLSSAVSTTSLLDLSTRCVVALSGYSQLESAASGVAEPSLTWDGAADLITHLCLHAAASKSSKSDGGGSGKGGELSAWNAAHSNVQWVPGDRRAGLYFYSSPPHTSREEAALHSPATLVVVPYPTPQQPTLRSLQVLRALACGVPVVTQEWVDANLLRISDGGSDVSSSPALRSSSAAEMHLVNDALLSWQLYRAPRYAHLPLASSVGAVGQRPGPLASRIFNGRKVIVGPSNDPSPAFIAHLVFLIGGRKVQSPKLAEFYLFGKAADFETWIQTRLMSPQQGKDVEDMRLLRAQLPDLCAQGRILTFRWLADSIEAGVLLEPGNAEFQWDTHSAAPVNWSEAMVAVSPPVRSASNSVEEKDNVEKVKAIDAQSRRNRASPGAGVAASAVPVVPERRKRAHSVSSAGSNSSGGQASSSNIKREPSLRSSLRFDGVSNCGKSTAGSASKGSKSTGAKRRKSSDPSCPHGMCRVGRTCIRCRAKTVIVFVEGAAPLKKPPPDVLQAEIEAGIREVHAPPTPLVKESTPSRNRRIQVKEEEPIDMHGQGAKSLAHDKSQSASTDITPSALALVQETGKSKKRERVQKPSTIPEPKHSSPQLPRSTRKQSRDLADPSGAVATPAPSAAVAAAAERPLVTASPTASWVAPALSTRRATCAARLQDAAAVATLTPGETPAKLSIAVSTPDTVLAPTTPGAASTSSDALPSEVKELSLLRLPAMPQLSSAQLQRSLSNVSTFRAAYHTDPRRRGTLTIYYMDPDPPSKKKSDPPCLGSCQKSSKRRRRLKARAIAQAAAAAAASEEFASIGAESSNTLTQREAHWQDSDHDHGGAFDEDEDEEEEEN